MRVVVVCADLAEGLAAGGVAGEVVVVPVLPPPGSGFRGEAAPVGVETWLAPLISPGIVAMALWTFIAHPRRSWPALAGAPPLEVAKGLWLANLAESWEAETVHATSARAAGVARVAAAVLGVPLTGP
ncbi:MAG: hypothetical protein FJZ01_05300 [Candidatus Sericytochromatia bacterium]|nr:hypothetical protein [Candidatus Tanganyikabacteria bacterium]